MAWPDELISRLSEERICVFPLPSGITNYRLSQVNLVLACAGQGISNSTLVTVAIYLWLFLVLGSC